MEDESLFGKRKICVLVAKWKLFPGAREVRQKQVRLPQGVDLATSQEKLAGLAADLFRSAVGTQAFKISRLVMVLVYEAAPNTATEVHVAPAVASPMMRMFEKSILVDNERASTSLGECAPAVKSESIRFHDALGSRSHICLGGHSKPGSEHDLVDGQISASSNGRTTGADRCKMPGDHMAVSTAISSNGGANLDSLRSKACNEANRNGAQPLVRRLDAATNRQSTKRPVATPRGSIMELLKKPKTTSNSSSIVDLT